MNTHTLPQTASAHFTCSESKSCLQRSTGIIYKEDVKSQAEVAGNECADEIAKYQASLKDNNLTDAGIPSAGQSGNPFYNIAWLAWEEARQSTTEPSSPIPNLTYFPDLKDTLKSHMHAEHRLVYTDRKTGY
eukprot:1157896-Pelagomonas_calceolata.AAC.1